MFNQFSHLFLPQTVLLEQRAGLQAVGAIPCVQCDNWMVPSTPGRQERVDCPSCHESFCSLCRRRPYHYRVGCDAAVDVADCWEEWVGQRRNEYLKELAKNDEKYLKQIKENDQALRSINQRADDFEEMERWKAQNCRVCPDCGRCIQHMGGCDNMTCGRDFYGTNVQTGCGKNFKWSQAQPYAPQQNGSHLDMLKKKLQKAVAEQTEEQQKQVWEITTGRFLRCFACKTVLQGPCFLCLNCHCLAVCMECHSHSTVGPQDQNLEQHSLQHVFRILWEPKELLKADIQVLQQHAQFGPDPRQQAKSAQVPQTGVATGEPRQLSVGDVVEIVGLRINKWVQYNGCTAEIVEELEKHDVATSRYAVVLRTVTEPGYRHLLHDPKMNFKATNLKLVKAAPGGARNRQGASRGRRAGEVMSDLCTICHCEFKAGERQDFLRCSHRFHFACLDRWHKKKIHHDNVNLEDLECPTCRRPV